MTFYNYGSKNGISTIIRWTKSLCRVYLAFSNPIISFINGSSLDSGKKTIVLAWLNGAHEACMILEEIQVTYEAK